jgi:UDP-N-acetylglucosamine 4,6-dehydratase
MDLLSIIGREKLLVSDMAKHERSFVKEISKSRFLVLGGAGSIGQAVVKELFKRNPIALHVVDISENNLVELVRDIRSSYGYIHGEFKTYALDIGSLGFKTYFFGQKQFDYVLNLSAIKHVRSEKDPYTLMRMVDVNIINTIKTIEMSIASGVKKYFCVSTDKAANPANMMGASKRIMEMFLVKYSDQIDISTARFANVAFSDGSLLHGFRHRLEKKQPIAAPNDVKRYFVTPQEAGELCLMSTILGENRDIFFPKLDRDLHLETFSDIARRFLIAQDYEPFECQSESEARGLVEQLMLERKWPCYFSASDTTGEKPFEEFYMLDEVVDFDTFESLGVVKNNIEVPSEILNNFLDTINALQIRDTWTRKDLIDLFELVLSGFSHNEKGKFLDEKM